MQLSIQNVERDEKKILQGGQKLSKEWAILSSIFEWSSNFPCNINFLT